MKKNLILFLFILLGFQIKGQVNRYGVPIIRNYATQITGGSEQNWCITKDKFGNLYFGNQDRGVIRYDGTKWTSIQVNKNPRIYSLESDTNGIVYVGAAFEFGYLQPDRRGRMEYISLASRITPVSDIKIIYSIVVRNGKVLFLGPKFLYVYDIENDSLTSVNLLRSGITDAYRLVKIDDKLIISDNLEGLFEMRDTTIIPLPGGNQFRNMSCTVFLSYGDNKVLVGTFEDGLYLYDYKTGEVRNNFISSSINEKFRKVFIYAAAKIKEDKFAIGTTNQEGILVFNRAGELIQQLNTENSVLEDNTAFAMFCDYKANSELWISTYGVLSKVYFNVPLTRFAEKQGIESGVNDICEFNGNTYLSSDAGILKSYIARDNSMRFRNIPNLSAQVFPLEVIESSSGDFLLAGSKDGVQQIYANDAIRKVDNILINKPEKQDYYLKKVLQSSFDPSIVYFGLEAGGVVFIKYENSRWYYLNRIKNIPGEIYGMMEKNRGSMWLLTDDPSGLYRLDFNDSDTTLMKYGPEKGIGDAVLHSIDKIDDDIYITTSSGIIRYDKTSDSFVPDNTITNGVSASKDATNLFQDKEGDIWYTEISESIDEYFFRRTINGPETYRGVLNMLPNVPLMDIMYSGRKIYFLKSKEVYVAEKDDLKTDSMKLTPSFVNIIVGADSIVMTGTFSKNVNDSRRVPVLTSTSLEIPEFKYDLNEISFEWTTPQFTEELLTEYSYRLDGFEKNWSKWEGISFGYTMEAIYSKREYTNLPYGHYIFRVRTRILTGMTGEELKYEFIILKPWYATIAAYFGFALIAFLIIVAIIKAYTKKLKNENIRLEGIVAERTAVVVKQKEELESSIHYASRIQMALLPSETILSDNIRNYFILFKPRDIVSGDFYWMTKKQERLYVVAADCTGHGVPGAFMSLLGMSFLDEILDRDPSLRADYILREMRLHVTESLKQTGVENESKDGMDLGLLVVDYANQHVEFSGAYNPCFRVRKINPDEALAANDDSSESAEGSMSNGKYILETIFASKMPIGISSRMDQNFVFEKWPLEKGVSYYLFSDGYIDQFGGPQGRKFMKKGFKRLILDIQDYPMEKQRELLDANIIEWRGNTPQIDDILVMGLKIE